MAPLVRVSRVSVAPAPRNVMPLFSRTVWPSLIVKVPALSCSTCPAGQALIALLIAPVSSCLLPFGESVAQTVFRVGMPPIDSRPAFLQFSLASRSAGSRSPVTGGGVVSGAVKVTPGRAVEAPAPYAVNVDAVERGGGSNRCHAPHAGQQPARSCTRHHGDAVSVPGCRVPAAVTAADSTTVTLLPTGAVRVNGGPPESVTVPFHVGGCTVQS